MPRIRRVQIEWRWLAWEKDFTWTDNVLPQLEEMNLVSDDLKTLVYVIVADGQFAISYPKRPSPTLYIGSGDLKRRFTSHLNWLNEMTELAHDNRFSIAICQPQTRDREPVHRQFEAELLHQFKELCGCIPIRNQRLERCFGNFHFEPKSEVQKPLIIGRGRRYRWEIKPLPSSRYYRSFKKRI
jgi:hypothetical protein